MHSTSALVFKTLADPTGRAILELLARGGEQTVRALTDPAGVSQPAVSNRERPKRDRLRWNRCRALVYCLSMIFSENRRPSIGS